MADGSIVINAEIDDKQAVAELKRVQREIEKTKTALSKTESQHNALSDQLRDAREEATRTESSIEALKAKLAEARAVFNQEQRSRGKNSATTVNSDEWYAARDSVLRYQQEIKAAEARLAEQNKLVESLDKKDQGVLLKLKQQNDELKKQESYQADLTRQQADRGTQGVRHLREETDKASKSAAAATPNFKKLFTKILKWGFGIRSIFILWRKLKAAIKEGFVAYANGDAETKERFNELKTALNSLKGQWATAFAPIISAVLPILTKFINWLTVAGEAVASFFSALGGKATYKKAVGNLNGVAGAAGKVEKSLMNIDEINKLNGDSGSGGGGSSGAYTLQDQLIPAAIMDIAKSLRENIANGDWYAVGQTVWRMLTDVLKNVFEITNFQEAAEKFGLLIRHIIEFGMGFLEEPLRKLFEYFKGYIVGNMENMSKDGNLTAWEIGLSIVDGILMGIADAIIDIGKWLWKNVFKPIYDGICEAFGIHSPSRVMMEVGKDIVDGLINGFTDKWNTFRTGLQSKWQSLKTWWQNLSLGAFNFKTPHITVQFEPLASNSLISKMLGITAIPHLGVQWYARGGVVDGATLIGAGEAGKEAIVPLERNMEWVTAVAKQLADYIVNNVDRFAGAFAGLNMPALASGSVVPVRIVGADNGMYISGQSVDRLFGMMDAMYAAIQEGKYIEVGSKIYLDRRAVGESVTEYQRGLSRSRG